MHVAGIPILLKNNEHKNSADITLIK